MSIASFNDFMKLDIRVGKITRAEPFPEARKPAFKLWVDMGSDLGEKKSSAQITTHYNPDQLIGKPVMSEILVLGVPDADGEVVLIVPDHDVPLGGRLF